MTHTWRAFPVALCVLAVGCGGKKPEAPKATSAGGTPAAAAATPVPAAAEAPKGIAISKFRLGSTAGPDGIVGVEAHVFGPGESVYTSFEILNPPAGSKIRAVWAALPDRRSVARQEAPLSADKPAVAFKADPKGWPAGDYLLEMFLVEAGKDDGRGLGSATFKVSREKQR